MTMLALQSFKTNKSIQRIALLLAQCLSLFIKITKLYLAVNDFIANPNDKCFTERSSTLEHEYMKK